MSRIRVSKKILSAGVAAALALTMCPMPAFATNTQPYADTWQGQSRLSVTAPVAIIFGSDGNGWDVNSTEMPKATGTFTSTGNPVRIKGVQYIEAAPDDPNKKAFDSMAGSSVYMSKSAESVPLASKQKIDLENAKSGTGTEISTAKNFVIFDKTSFDFQLALPSSGVNKSQADGGQTAYQFGKLKYVFETTTMNFWLSDLRVPSTPRVYTLDEVKAQALKVADLTDTSDEAKYWRDMYYQFATYATIDPTTPGDTGKDGHDGRKNYTCGIKLGSPYNKFYDLRILGTNQDELVTYNNGIPAPSGQYAGVTFMFGEAVTTAPYWSHTGNAVGIADNSPFDGWGDKKRDGTGEYRLYNAMQKTDAQFDTGRFGAIYDAIGASDIKTVYKFSASGQGRITETTGDPTAHTDSANQLFVLSTSELVGDRGGYSEKVLNKSDGSLYAEMYYHVTFDGFMTSNGFRCGQYQYFGGNGLGIRSTWEYVSDDLSQVTPSHHPGYAWTQRYCVPNRAFEELAMKYQGQPISWWGRTQCGWTAMRGSGVSENGIPQPWWVNYLEAVDDGSGPDLVSVSEHVLYGNENIGVVPCFCL